MITIFALRGSIADYNLQTAIAEATAYSRREADVATSYRNALEESIEHFYHSYAQGHSPYSNSYEAMLAYAAQVDAANPEEALKKGIKEFVNIATDEEKKEVLNRATNDGHVAAMTPGDKKLASIAAAALDTTNSAVKSLEQPALDPNTSAVHEAVTGTIAHAIAERIDITQYSAAEVAEAGELGASAGDEEALRRNNVWLSGIYGSSTQSKIGAASGYKGKLAGGTLGLDVEIMDGLTLGLAYSNVGSVFKYKQDTIGDKTTATSHVLSLYSNLNLNEHFVWKNIASISKSNVKTINGRVNNSIATGKFKSDAFNFDTNLGYKITKNGVTFMPNVGLRYGFSKDDSYKEKDAGLYHQDIGSQKSESLVGSFGANVMFKHELESGIKLTPSLHASVELNLMDKVQKVRAKLEFQDDYIKSTADTTAKVAYNVGGGIVAAKGNIEVSANYNLNLAKKYQAHQGSLKLRVMF